jgi:CSLREA domain-containing protein
MHTRNGGNIRNGGRRRSAVRRWSAVLVAAGLATGAILLLTALPSPAGAQFTVNDTGDDPDANVGNGVCATIDGKCTLRAAIQELNASGVTSTIQFSIGSGVPVILVGTSFLVPGEPLPPITRPVTINGNTGGATRVALDGTAVFAGTTGALPEPTRRCCC